MVQFAGIDVSALGEEALKVYSKATVQEFFADSTKLDGYTKDQIVAKCKSTPATAPCTMVNLLETYKRPELFELCKHLLVPTPTYLAKKTMFELADLLVAKFGSSTSETVEPTKPGAAQKRKMESEGSSKRPKVELQDTTKIGEILANKVLEKEAIVNAKSNKDWSSILVQLYLQRFGGRKQWKTVRRAFEKTLEKHDCGRCSQQQARRRYCHSFTIFAH